MPEIAAGPRRRGVLFRFVALSKSAVSPIFTSVRLTYFTPAASVACRWPLPLTLPPVPSCAVPTVVRTAPKARCPGQKADPHPFCPTRGGPPGWNQKLIGRPNTHHQKRGRYGATGQLPRSVSQKNSHPRQTDFKFLAAHRCGARESRGAHQALRIVT